MLYSKEGIRELCLDVDKILIDGDKYNDKVTSIEDLQNRLRRKAKFKEIDFQDKCEGGNSLGDLLLKHATENNNPHVKDFLLQNGFKLPAAINKEEEAPNVEENKSDSNTVGSSNCKNPSMTAEVLYEQLIQGKETNLAIFDSFANAVRESNITGDRGVFLDVVKLFIDLDPVIHLTDTTSSTILGIAAITKQADVVRILLNSGKFEEEEKISALNSAIIQGNVQEFEVFLDYIDHAKILGALNTASCNENTNIMKVLLDNKRFTEKEKVQALSHASIDGDLPKVRLLLKYMTGIPANGIRNLLEIIEGGKSPFEEELRTGSEFKVKVDFDNSDHCKYLSNRVIIALLRSAINNTPGVEENRARSSSSGGNSVGTGQTAVLDSDSIEDLCEKIERTIACAISYGGKVPDLGNLKNRLKKEDFNLQDKGNALLEQAVKKERLNVIKFLLRNGVTIINTIEEGRCYISKIKENESILCSVVSYTDDSNVEILSMLLQNINAEQLKLGPESELYRLYQQLKDDAFCTAFEKRNSVAAAVLIQNDQERIASHELAVNDNETPIATEPPISTNGGNLNHDNKIPKVVTTSSVEGGDVDDEPVLPVVSTHSVPIPTSSGGNKPHDFREAQFSPPNEKETKYKESKGNFHTSLRNDAVGVVITGLFIAAAVMVPFAAGAVICGVIAALVAVCTGLHIKNSTLPSYREMEENKIEHVSSKTAQTL